VPETVSVAPAELAVELREGLSTRRHPVGLEPVGVRTEQAATATSKSAGVAAVRHRARPRWPSRSPQTCPRWIWSR